MFLISLSEYHFQCLTPFYKQLIQDLQRMSSSEKVQILHSSTVANWPTTNRHTCISSFTRFINPFYNVMTFVVNIHAVALMMKNWRNRILATEIETDMQKVVLVSEPSFQKQLSMLPPFRLTLFETKKRQ